MDQWAKDGRYIYTGHRNEGGADFRSGECALFTESSAGYAGVKAEAQFAFKICPLPYWVGIDRAPQNAIIGGSSLWVMGGYEPEENKGVAEFFAFLSTTDIQAKWHQDTGYLSTTIAAAEKPRQTVFYHANSGIEIAGMQMTGKAPTGSSKGLRLGSFDQIRVIIDEELQAVWSGDKSARAAFDGAKERGDQLLGRFEQANKWDLRAEASRLRPLFMDKRVTIKG